MQKKIAVTPEKPKKAIKPPQDTMNEIQRQYARISRKMPRKSNFYLDKQDRMRIGQPVGRGSKKQKE